MKLLLILFVFCAMLLCNCEQIVKDHYDLSDGKDHVFVVELLFRKIAELVNLTTYMDTKLEAINKRTNGLEERLNTVANEGTAKIDSRLGAINKRFDELERRLNDVDWRFTNFYQNHVYNPQNN